MSTKFSIIIPCLNEERYLKECLFSLRSQNYPRELFEIIVVDNGSLDGSLEIARNLADIAVSLPKANVGAVRNFGSKYASSQFLVFIDADCTVDVNWLNRANHILASSSDVVFGGGCLLPQNPVWVEKYWLLEDSKGNSLPSALIGCSILINRDIFDRIGGFDENLASGEDSLLHTMLRANGYQIVISSD